MKKIVVILASASVTLAAPALSQSDIGTIERGTYACEMPGSVRGAAGIPQPEASFTIESASRYTSAQGDGTYLRLGDEVRMTSGPRNGKVYKIMSRGFLRLAEEDGSPGKLRCIYQGR